MSKEDYPQEDFTKGLRKIKIRRWQFWLTLIGYIPMTILVFKTIIYLFSASTEMSETIGVSCAIGYMFLIVVMSIRNLISICPRCNNDFCHYNNMICKKCQSCGLNL